MEFADPRYRFAHDGEQVRIAIGSGERVGHDERAHAVRKRPEQRLQEDLRAVEAGQQDQRRWGGRRVQFADRYRAANPGPIVSGCQRAPLLRASVQTASLDRAVSFPRESASAVPCSPRWSS